ncbi:unnamed protein product [Allacma fusca]|uniref:Peptidase M14 domain-containing protein n=1 Tax=Allacma fusca TaxID=39272 RepID=A0A8J2KYZ0_9HEXA|nr:unnamed protein product [Allacma fusca]
MDLGRRIGQATAARYGTNYTVGNWFELLYLSTGCSVDWVKKTYNTNLTLTYEMRDTGRYGFLLPPEQIIPSAEEFLDGFAVAIAELRAGIITPDLPPDVLEANPKRIQRASSILPQQDFNTFGKAPHPRQSVSPLEAFIRV